MKKNRQWYVITGGPSSGKTTLINELAAAGYITVLEAARFLIEQKITRGITVEKIQNTSEFQKEVLKLQLKNEQDAPKDKAVFFDRAIPDGLAYCKFQKLNIKEYEELNMRGRYETIFFCEQLSFDQDNVRIENFPEAQELSCLIRRTYHELGYRIIDLAAGPSPKNRMKIILNHLNGGVD